MSNPPAVPSRLSKSALFSFIFGLLGCIPFLTGIVALILAIVGLVATGKPGVRGRWMAVVGIILAILSIGFWSTAGLGIAASWAGIKSAVAVMTAPGHGARDFIRAVDSGDEAAAKDLTVMNDTEFTVAKALIKAQGGFIDSTFSQVNIVNNDARVSGSGSFKTGNRTITADMVKIGDQWKVKSLSITP
jgi:hypothetical protein